MSQSAKSRAVTAKRVSKHRGKNVENCNGGSVTKTLPEKRREEKSINKPPNPLSGGTGSESVESKPSTPKKSKPRFAPESITLPEGLADCPNFIRAWFDWIAYRRTDLKKPLTERSAKMQISKFEQLGAAAAVDAINEAIKNGWQGVAFATTTKPERARMVNLKSDRGKSTTPTQPTSVHSDDDGSRLRRLAWDATAKAIGKRYAGCTLGNFELYDRRQPGVVDALQRFSDAMRQTLDAGNRWFCSVRPERGKIICWRQCFVTPS